MKELYKLSTKEKAILLKEYVLNSEKKLEELMNKLIKSRKKLYAAEYEIEEINTRRDEINKHLISEFQWFINNIIETEEA